jgi:hypothetical protein
LQVVPSSLGRAALLLLGCVRVQGCRPSPFFAELVFQVPLPSKKGTTRF